MPYRVTAVYSVQGCSHQHRNPRWNISLLDIVCDIPYTISQFYIVVLYVQRYVCSVKGDLSLCDGCMVCDIVSHNVLIRPVINTYNVVYVVLRAISAFAMVAAHLSASTNQPCRTSTALIDGNKHPHTTTTLTAVCILFFFHGGHTENQPC